MAMWSAQSWPSSGQARRHRDARIL
jgi:hypothetical protein